MCRAVLQSCVGVRCVDYCTHRCFHNSSSIRGLFIVYVAGCVVCTSGGNGNAAVAGAYIASAAARRCYIDSVSASAVSLLVCAMWFERCAIRGGYGVIGNG